MANRGITNIDVYCQDTDVLELLVRRARHLTRNTRFFGAKGILNIRIFHKLGEKLALELSGFHAISGADVTGSFSGKGKRKCWKAF